ncbi:MAG TPA: DUF5069 domain-containing protein [Candidatus Tumulicola sp.]|nr:DUF5069 domain-containing protein [Candidatus Tumulicola sp.]
MGWIPCSGLNSVAGLVWLPRLLEKARRCETTQNGHLVDGYCYGDNDFIDKQLIAFLRTNDATISTLVKEHPADIDVARMLVDRSGRSPAECEAFNKTFRRRNFDFVLLEADEGRLRPGLKAAILKFTYNNVMMPAIYWMFRRDERNRNAG